LRIFGPNFTCLLHVPIYVGLQNCSAYAKGRCTYNWNRPTQIVWCRPYSYRPRRCWKTKTYRKLIDHISEAPVGAGGDATARRHAALLPTALSKASLDISDVRKSDDRTIILDNVSICNCNVLHHYNNQLVCLCVSASVCLSPGSPGSPPSGDSTGLKQRSQVK